MYDIAIIGGGISGFATALRLQNKGFKTIVFESHGQLGGCAGFFSEKGFSFDVGATTLVDFSKGGIGGDFFEELNFSLPEGEYIDYVLWLPDRKVTLYRDAIKWNKERLEKIGTTKNHIEFWNLIDKTTEVFWRAARKNIRLPIKNLNDIIYAFRVIGAKNIYLLKYQNYTMLDILKKFKLENDKALKGLLSVLIEDTVNSTIDKAPFINASLGCSIRGAGLMRATGGMKGFWNYLSKIYLSKDGVIKKAHKVLSLSKDRSVWTINTSKGSFYAKKIVSSLPIDLTYNIAPIHIKKILNKYMFHNKEATGGAIVIFLGVPESNLENEILTHHQILLNYDSPLGNGNNMFISISSKDDTLSAPLGYRSVMISTHCDINEWKNLSEHQYQLKKEEIGKRLLGYAKRVYPNLVDNGIIYKIGSPLTYQKFTNRVNGSVGGFKQTLENSNFNSIPQNIGEKDLWIVGDNTWPGLGTVAGLIGSKIVSKHILETF
ncbi:phytoene desaturase family protein [Cytophaga hutchinsonii]|uniref:UDP-galactopyranose mutase n=1 Tax=Cytophaga hutchinsonii (strain ATCC 33406 / DSM 1761 / CIP 103989 / NBRC 15051 / NCIMB 9469 / D465) TaxID=269798 RepID=A0A6N4SVQ0_CYTH3|nr:FAD-dependent oxidoreductase [Cytophaga hutchinsonii]ABG60680.1 UDP-galactopyranose mutase [Cytophaga hutchinsonii ATCC 33406]SFX69414.1 C-3',4' desaturase CrtD [Cytophaga hutchinsonii ATCC 33406]